VLLGETTLSEPTRVGSLRPEGTITAVLEELISQVSIGQP